ncbi:MAG: hypothetical protein HOK82_06480 [Rhodospirillaceae bacterium]|jgi:hypothetical protein|nr:hypothetical protein [Rhodospirillaceae bacterium]
MNKRIATHPDDLNATLMLDIGGDFRYEIAMSNEYSQDSTTDTDTNLRAALERFTYRSGHS